MNLSNKCKNRMFIKCFVAVIIVLNAITNLFGQTYVNGAMDQPNITGEYYHNNSITLKPGFSTTGPFHAYITTSLPIPVAFSGDQNYASTWVPRIKVQTALQLKAIEGNNNEVTITVKYFDGLGRPIQNIEKSASPSGLDLVQPYEYDEQSRQIKAYLPYTSISGAPGSYRENSISSEQPSFYNNGSNLIAQSSTPYARSLFENSPLERLVEQGGVGDYGQLTGSGIANSGHTVRYVYTENNNLSITDVSNTRVAVLYNVNIDINGIRTLTSNGYYPDNDLFVKIIKDENWQVADGRAGTYEVYTDKRGKDILKRAFLKVGNDLKILSTYYVYDDFGNLSFILPPAAIPDQPNAGTIDPDLFSKFCYQYRFDEKQRLVAEKTPGKDWKYIVYNILNQVVAVQDGNDNLKKEWVIKKYDAQGRVIITGIWNNSNTAITREYLQSILNEEQTLWETKIQMGNGYTSSAWPQTINKYYTINYYDDYEIPALPANFSYQVYTGNPEGKSELTNGLLTASKTWSLANPGTELWAVKYYNSDSKTIQVQSSNNVSGRDIFNTEYDVVGNVTKTSQLHISSTQNVLLTNRFEYDHHGRQVKQYKKIGSDGEILLSQQEYNDLGQLIDKKLHQKLGNNRFLQSIDYRYNIKGKLISKNDPGLAVNSSTNTDDPAVTDADKFSMALNYEEAAIPQFNGVIGAMQWKTTAAGGVSNPAVDKYDFRYDKLNRLTEAVSSASSNKDRQFDEYVSYDQMGNIHTLGRWAKLNTGRVQIDSLIYSYQGNQADHVDDLTNNNTYGFIETTKQAGEYGYDANGNLNKDLNKGITSIIYNSFDLPETITWNDGKSITYDYDGEGNKLRKVFHTGSTTLTTDYAGDMQYEQNQLAFINTEEGIARRNTNGSFIYQYALTDHLGNTRVMIQPVYPAETAAEIIQVSNYYPFGLEMKSNDPNSLISYVNGDKNNYLFNGKEEQLPTAMYDFGARLYDPATGRWNAPDPAKQFVFESPYAALANNPVAHVDPDGRILPFVAAAIGAAIGGTINVAVHWKQISKSGSPWRDGFVAFGIGGVAGAVAGLTGGASLAATGAGVSTLAAIGTATAAAAYSSATASLIQGVGNAMYFGDSYGFKEFFSSAIIGGVTGGLLKGWELSVTNGVSVGGESGYVSAWGDEAIESTNMGAVNIDAANWAQKTFRSTFSDGGAFSGKTINEVSKSLIKGEISVKTVPIDVVVRNGQTFILNTRSSVALINAGIPRSAWAIVNRTGQQLFETNLTNQLIGNNLVNTAGTNIIRQAGTNITYSR